MLGTLLSPLRGWEFGIIQISPTRPFYRARSGCLILELMATIHMSEAEVARDLHAVLAKAYAPEPFVHVLPFGATPQTRHVRGSNMTFIGVAADRIPGRAIIVSALDNLTKGASGQAVQNMNVMLGLPETTGLEQVALFP